MIYADMNNEEQKNLIKSYFDREIEVIKRLNLDDINAAVQAIWAAYKQDATIYIFGNGGSAVTASHFVCDFNKGISEKKEKKFNFVCLNDNYSMMMAIANDISYDDIFRYPLVGKLKSTDLVIGISGSGNSKNVIRAVEYAKEIGAHIIGITGYHGGKLKELADYHMDVMEDDMQISEDIHMVFNHMMYFVLNQE
ncbi:MAG: SIS domain-containing protein [Clostridiales bacterium]|nr:SIS domain-containing protein [Clostridiales bacterium]